MEAAASLKLVVDLLTLLNVLYQLHTVVAKDNRKRNFHDGFIDAEHPLPGGKIRRIPFVKRPRTDQAGNRTHDYSKRNYWESPWGEMLLDDHVNGPRNPKSRLGKDFRRDFAVPYKVFAYIVYLAKARGWGGVGATDAIGLPAAPIELKILGVLFCLRGDHKFHSVKKLSNIDQETQRKFFIAFNASFSCDLFDIWVASPKTEADLKRVTDQYQAVGLPGCCGSIDCTHCGVDKMPVGLKTLLIGKEGYPTLSFEVRVRYSFIVWC